MPVSLKRRSPAAPARAGLASAGGGTALEARGSDASALTIGLLNNMPDAALQATERQFAALLGAAADGLTVHLRPYALPDVPRAEWGREYVGRSYAPIDELWNARLDGLIVTGTEPRSPDLAAEPYWPDLTAVVDWAERNTISAVWSCLATHAAVLHLDGVQRRPLADKRFGVFECECVSDHALTADAGHAIHMPHSRWNEIPVEALTACGYQVLTRSPDAGVDLFVKRRPSLFVFFQGHPEYETETLMLEYRRDIRRFLTGERETYPTMPHGYFATGTAEVLAALAERARLDRREELLAEFPTALALRTLANSWRPAAVGLYRNWIRYLAEHKDRP